MILISHRGNISGKDAARENKPDYISKALAEGYHVEVVVWVKGDELYLGHDYPVDKCPESFLRDERIWFHTKNLAALEMLITKSVPNFFWHQEDSYTLTSNGFIWAYPGKQLSGKSIAVLPEQGGYSKEYLSQAAGICSDTISAYRELS